MGRVTQRRKVHKIVLDGSPQALEFPVRYREDVLAVEEPLEIRPGATFLLRHHADAGKRL
ncbi:hypothetical protein QFZ65_003443 [Arthrobacter sp. B3I9]|nr:hypothetical protein [Arthrobacter sp. B3I9]